LTNLSKTDQKLELKKQFFSVHSIKQSTDKPLVIVDLSQNVDFKWIAQLINGIAELDFPMVVLGNTNLEIPKKILQIKEKEQFEGAYDASDFVLLPKMSASKLMQAWSNRVVPICEKSDLTSNYDPIEEKGNSFTVEISNEWGFFAALIRATETYKFPYDWKHLLDQCQKSL